MANDEGPWRDKLTEDQDLGLRLIAAGWEGRQDLRATVNQQGLSKLRPLFRQRTRWSQGNLQAIGLRREVLGTRRSASARGSSRWPTSSCPSGRGSSASAWSARCCSRSSASAPFWGAGPTYQLVFFYLLAFGGTSLGCIAARAEQGPVGWLLGFLIGQVYTIYTWFLWPVLVRSTVRQLSGQGSWAKTEREAITDGGSRGAAAAQSPVARQTQSIASG